MISSSFTKLLKEHPIWMVLLGASLLRFWGIWHGYPFSYYPDEQHFVNRSVSLGSGDLNPHWFHKPAFLMYLLFAEYGLFFVFGKIIGWFPNSEAFAVYFFQSSWAFVLIGRITVTLFGIGTVYVIYKTGKDFWSEKVGILGAFFLSITFAHVFSGQDVKADVPATFFSVLSVYFILRTLKYDFRSKDYVLAALFAGLGTAAKYYSIALLPCIFLVSLVEVIRLRNILSLRKYLYALVTYWGVYFAVSPYNFLDPLGRESTFGIIVKVFNKISPFKLDLYQQIEGYENFLITDYQGNYLLKSALNYLKVLLSSDGCGIVLGSVFILSLVYIVLKPSLKSSLFISFPIVFSLISITWNPSYTEPRHQVIIYPFLALCSGVFLVNIFEKINKNSFNILILIMLALHPVAAIVQNNIFSSRIDTRSLAKQWIEENIPTDTKILLDTYSPELKMNRKRLETMLEKSRTVEQSQFTTHMSDFYQYKIKALEGVAYDLKIIRHVWWRYKELKDGESTADTEYDKDMANPVKEVGVSDYSSYKKNGYQYFITSNLAYVDYLNPKKDRGDRFPSFKKFYEEVFSQGVLIKEFDPSKLELPGPLIKVIKIN